MASVKKRGDRYDVRWRDGNRARSRTFRRKADADNYAATVVADKARGLYVDDRLGRVTLTAYAKSWAESQLWRQGSRDVHAAHMHRWITPELGDRRLSAITESDVRALVTKMTAAGLAPSTVTAVLRRLRSILAAAVRDGAIPRNPAALVRPPRAEGRTAEQRAAALSPEQLAQLLDELPGRLRALALTMALAGLRPGEAAGLTVDRVDHLRHTLTVDRQLVTPSKGRPSLGPPKSPASVRTLPLPDALSVALLDHVNRYPLGPDGLLFLSRDGHPLRRNTLADTWARATTELDLPAAVRGWHSLRHTYASAQLAAGTPLPVVSRLLGHASLAETMSVYAHALPDADDQARNAAAEVLLTPRAETVGPRR